MAKSTPRETDCREKGQYPTLLRRRWLLSLALSGSVACFLDHTWVCPAVAGGTSGAAFAVDATPPSAALLKNFETSPVLDPVVASKRGADQTAGPTTAKNRPGLRTGAYGDPSSNADGDAGASSIFGSAIYTSLLKYLSPLYGLRSPLRPTNEKQNWFADGFCRVSRPLDEQCRVYFDHIVVGCGASGCPFARTLAEGGKKVLLIERGLERSYEKTPNCMDVYGCGRVIMDETVSQPIVTKQGIRTHVGSVMGGGTSLNKGIVVEEEPEYFEYLNKNFGYKWDIPRVYEAYNWVGKQIYFPAPQDRPFAKAWTTSLVARGYKPLMPHGHHYSGGPLPAHYRFKLGYVWGGGLFFNSKEGFYRYATDTLLGGDKGRKRVENLTVLTDHAVQRILFDRSSGGRPRAVCILYRKTAYEDIQTLGAMHNAVTKKMGRKAATYFTIKHAKKAALYYSRHSKAATERLKKACVHSGGEITLAAGAIHTPLLLIRSGIGSKEQLEEIGAPIVKILPHVGKNLRDRLFIPLSFFSVIKKTDRTHYPTRICEAIGVAKLGPDCRNFKIGDRSLKCTLAGAEALYGGRMTEGVILGSRYIFPPAFRHHPLVDKAVEIMIYCARHRPLIQHMHDYLPICVTIEPLINCFRRGSAPFYFTAEPKTSGHVRIDKHGEVEVDFNYMKDEQDVFDAVRGMQNLLEAAKDDSWKGVLEPLSLTGCPVQILNRMLDLVATVAVTVYGEILHEDALRAIRRDINLLLPGNTTVTTGQHEEAFPGTDALVTEETLPQYRKILERLQQKQDRIEFLLRATDKILLPQQSHNWQQMLQQLNQPLQHGRASEPAKENASTLFSDGFLDDWSSLSSPDAEDEPKDDTPTGRPAHSALLDEDPSLLLSSHDHPTPSVQDSCGDRSFEQGFIRTCPAKDPYEHFYPTNTNKEGTITPPKGGNEKLFGDNEEIRKLRESLDPQDLGRFWSNVLRPGTNSSQWLASYPPVLPRTDHPEEVARFVFAYMTSLWHLHGTSEMGKVIDPDFNVIGVDNLSVVDASALSRVTRMNPTATLIMLGRYVGLRKLEAWQKRTPPPLVMDSAR